MLHGAPRKIKRLMAGELFAMGKLTVRAQWTKLMEICVKRSRQIAMRIQITIEGETIMFTRSVSCAILTLALLIGSASSQEGNSRKTHDGGCIMISAASKAPKNLYINTGVLPTEEYKPFTKKITVYGYTLIGRDNISDDFMRRVAQTITETLPRNESINHAQQKTFMRKMYEHRALIPLINANALYSDMSPEEELAWDETKSKNSVCDSIHENEGDRQVMEVVEHILHYANDVGLHYAYPEKWAVKEGSMLHRFMLEAVEKGYYDDTSYNRIEDPERRLRVKLQEFGYMIITTAWDLQEPYGGGGDEWTRGGTIVTSADLKEKMPKLYAMYEDTVMKIMTPPSLSTLEGFNE